MSKIKSERLQKISEFAMLFFIISFFITNLVLNFKFNFFQMRTKAVASITIEMFMIIICGFLFFSAMIDERKTDFRKRFLQLTFFESIAFFTDTIYWYTAKIPSYNTLLIIDN